MANWTAILARWDREGMEGQKKFPLIQTTATTTSFSRLQIHPFVSRYNNSYAYPTPRAFRVPDEKAGLLPLRGYGAPDTVLH